MKATAIVSGLVLAACLSGCAVGRDESTGAIILGIEAGRLVETGPQAIAAAVGTFLPGAGPIVGTIAGLLGIGGAVHYRSKRNGERAGWDERGREVVDSPAGPIAYVPAPVAPVAPVVLQPSPVPDSGAAVAAEPAPAPQVTP